MAIFEKGILPRLYWRFLHKYYAQDLLIDLKLAAKAEAVAYMQAHLRHALLFKDRDALLLFALAEASEPGLICEFGVEKGHSLTLLANAAGGRVVHGFDSFRGLPDHWTGTFEARGKFDLAGRLPKVPGNAELHVGWFDETLPKFLGQRGEAVAFLHVDCDIYSSTRTVFEHLGPRLQPGAVIVFDEYFNYPGWREHEWKAFQEWIARTGRSYRYIGFATEKGHVAVRLD